MTDASSVPTSVPGRRVRDFVVLVKPRISSFIVLTAATGMFLIPGEKSPSLFLLALLCIALGSQGSAALNMWYERDIDGLMERTKGRPLPAGRLRATDALIFGTSLCVVSLALMFFVFSWLPTFFLFLSIFIYVAVYTVWLKRRTPQGVVIGGAAGALPPVIGWVALTGHLSWEPVLLFLIIFFWTPPHFWALSLFRAKDYKAAGLPMLPLVKGMKATRRTIVLYSFVLAVLGLLPALMLGPLYGVVAFLLGALFCALAVRVLTLATDRAARQLFFYSILYVFALFLSMMVTHFLTL